MKTLLHITMIVSILITSIAAQNPHKGLYLTANDYKNGKISFSSKTTKIKPHLVFKKSLIQVKYNDSLYTFLKKDVFGYVDKDGTYRLNGKDVYTIINPGEEIVIYKTTSGTGFKNSPIVDSYFFSKSAGEPIQSLTLYNVVRAFSDNKSFTKLIELSITSNDGLLQYDVINREYRINRLLALARTW